MDALITLKSPKLDPAVWRPDVPLIVIEKCLTQHYTTDGRKLDPAKLICTWLAVRWLMAALPGRRAHPTRQIAERVGAHMTSVTDWLLHLIELGLVVKEAEIKPPRNLTRAGPQLEVTLDLIELERQSREIALTVLLRLNTTDTIAPPPALGQLALDLSSDRLSDQTPDRLSDQTPDRLSDQSASSDRLSDQTPDRLSDQSASSDRLSDQTPDRLSDQTPDRLSDQHGGGGGGFMEEDESRARANDYPSVAVPDNAWPLPHHPFDLWRAASDAPLPEAHLRALAAEHDVSTQGFGWYWVGRAILAASLKDKIKYVARVRQVLKTYTRRGYGADLYEDADAHPTTPARLRNDRTSDAINPAARARAGQSHDRVDSVAADVTQPF